MTGSGLLALLHLCLQLCEHVEVAESGRSGHVLNLRSVFLLGGTRCSGSILAGGSALLVTCGILEGAAVAENDTFRLLVELNDLEGQLLACNSLRAILLDEVLRRAKPSTLSAS